MLRRTASRSGTTSWPADRGGPAVGLASVHSMLIVVVLPAPLGPRNPNTSPVATSKSTPRTASTSPKVLTSFCTVIADAGDFPLDVPAICASNVTRSLIRVLGQDPVQRAPGLGQGV